MTNDSAEKKSFWVTLPGILTGVAAVITATVALLGALNSAGIFEEPAAENPSTTLGNANAPATENPSTIPADSNAELKVTNLAVSDWGSYSFIASLGEGFFTGYSSGYLKDISKDKILGSDLACKILNNDIKEQTITSSTPLILEQNYQLTIKSIDIDGNKAYIELAKDGEVVQGMVVSPSVDGATLADKTFYYTRNIGNTEGIATIAVHFKRIARSTDGQNIAFIDGVWQISDESQIGV